MKSIGRRLNDINWQLQNEEAKNLASLNHFKSPDFYTNPSKVVFNIKCSFARKITAMILLNCPGALIIREHDMKFCSSCNEVLDKRNVFCHYIYKCKCDRSKITELSVYNKTIRIPEEQQFLQIVTMKNPDMLTKLATCFKKDIWK